MYNKRLVVSYLSLLGFQQLFLVVFVLLGIQSGMVSSVGLFLSWASIIIVVDIIFFILVMMFQWEQTRYIVLGVSSIVLSLTYLLVLFNSLLDINIPYVGDINMLATAILILVSGYIMVDDTTYNFVKWILFGNLLIMLLFRTPLFLLFVTIVQRFFQATDVSAFDVWIWMFVSHSVTVLLLGVFKAYMMNRIDFL